MLVSYQWLNEYVDIPNVTPHELADKMSRTGIEVEEVTVPSEGLKKIVVGYVSECVPHPDSDHLSVCQVDIGESELSQIVCGAPNVTKGKKVIVALPGARIVDNTKIKKGKIRGQVSNGMLCSLQELGYKDSLIPKEYADGIFFLPEDSTVGESVFPLLSMEDSIIELSITPNRADALSMRGVAYEVGAIYKKQPTFDAKELRENPETKIEDKVTISIENNQDAPIYKMRIIENVQIKESPLWLQMRLINAGIRPINNVVDVTNYIMLYYGQPMHAFDFDKISSNKINVRRANQDEQLVTLDGQERTMSIEDVVITDGTKPIALAGVMGGLNSEIDNNTTTVALESAVFDSILVRKTSKKFNLRSESSSRFEKGINEGTVGEACDYAASMICELAGGNIVQGMAIGSDKKLNSVTVDVSESEINRLLGTKLSIKEISDIFVALGFPYEESTGDFCITVPSRRWDITIAADIVEEVARIYGYDNIPSTLPKNVSIPGELTQGQKIIRKTKEILEGSGVSEVISYALTTEKKATEFSLIENTPVAIDWPMSEDRSFLRMNITSGLLDDISYNVARKNSNLAFFEIGHVFSAVENNKQLPEEREHLGIALIGDWKSKDWDETQEKVDFYLLKGIIETLFTNLGILNDIEFKPSTTLTSMHPGRTASIVYKENIIGFIGQVHPKTANDYDISEVYACEIDLSYIIDNYSTSMVYEAVSKFPSVKRDIALLSDKSVLNSDIIETIKTNGGKYLKQVVLFDLYEGQNLSNDKKSLAYSLTFQNEESTMTEEDITKGMDKISKALEEELNITIR